MQANLRAYTHLREGWHQRCVSTSRSLRPTVRSGTPSCCLYLRGVRARGLSVNCLRSCADTSWLRSTSHPRPRPRPRAPASPLQAELVGGLQPWQRSLRSKLGNCSNCTPTKCVTLLSSHARPCTNTSRPLISTRDVCPAAHLQHVGPHVGIEAGHQDVVVAVHQAGQHLIRGGEGVEMRRSEVSARAVEETWSGMARQAGSIV